MPVDVDPDTECNTLVTAPPFSLSMEALLAEAEGGGGGAGGGSATTLPLVESEIDPALAPPGRPWKPS